MKSTDINDLRFAARRLDGAINSLETLDRLNQNGELSDADGSMTPEQEKLQDELVELLYRIDAMVDESNILELPNGRTVELPRGPPSRSEEDERPFPPRPDHAGGPGGPN